MLSLQPASDTDADQTQLPAKCRQWPLKVHSALLQRRGASLSLREPAHFMLWSAAKCSMMPKSE